jgi:hypothetical protein
MRGHLSAYAQYLTPTHASLSLFLSLSLSLSLFSAVGSALRLRGIVVWMCEGYHEILDAVEDPLENYALD